MKFTILFTLALSFLFFNNCTADSIIWNGEVKADGSPTKPIKLILGETYIIKTKGVVNLGKWWIQGVPLASDACYEFNEKLPDPIKHTTLKNSLEISVCTEAFNKEHIYESKPFKAAQSLVHFWINDIDYDDNNGSLLVQIVHINNP